MRRFLARENFRLSQTALSDLAATEGNRTEAALLFQKIQDARDSSGLSQWAEQRLKSLEGIERK